MSVRTKVVFAVLIGLLISGALGSWVVDRAYRDSISLVSQRELENSARAFRDLQRAETEALKVGTSVIAADPRVAAAMASADRAALEDVSRELHRELVAEHGISHWYYEGRPVDGGSVILRVHRPELHGDRLERLTYRQAVVTGTGSGLELGKTAFALRVVRAVKDEGGQVVGYVELGKEIANFLAELRATDGNDYTLVVSKSRLEQQAEQGWDEIRAVYPLAGQWDDDPHNLLVDSTTPGDDIWRGDIGALPDEGSVIRTGWDGDSAQAVVAFPVDDAGGTRIGAVLARIDVTDFYEKARSAQLRVLLGIGAIMFVLGISLTWYMDRILKSRSLHAE